MFAKKHLDYLVSELVDYDNDNQRSFMERDHLPPVRMESEEFTLKTKDTEVDSYVDGLLR